MAEGLSSFPTVVPDRLVLATSVGLAPDLIPWLPGCVTVTDPSQLQEAIDAPGASLVRLVSVGYGWIVPGDLLNRCRAGAVNFHPGTPDYPGSAGNHLVLYEGADMFGVTAHAMAPAVDAGPILATLDFPIPNGIGHRSLDTLTVAALLSLFQQLAPCLRGLAAWPTPPACSWRGTARRRAEVLTLAQGNPTDDDVMRLRRWRAFHEGPDSILTIWTDGGATSYRPGGRVRGWIDGIVGDAIHGWAWDPAHSPVMVLTEVDGQPLYMLKAEAYRADVAAAGHGDGHCGFRLPLQQLSANWAKVEFILPTDEWCRVPGSPVNNPKSSIVSL